MRSPLVIFGIALLALGVVALAYQGITYTTREKVVDLGPIKISADKEKTIPLPRSWVASRWPPASSRSSSRRAAGRADRGLTRASSGPRPAGDLS